jgi:hypothetical protein
MTQHKAQPGTPVASLQEASDPGVPATATPIPPRRVLCTARLAVVVGGLVLGGLVLGGAGCQQAQPPAAGGQASTTPEQADDPAAVVAVADPHLNAPEQAAAPEPFAPRTAADFAPASEPVAEHSGGHPPENSAQPTAVAGDVPSAGSVPPSGDVIAQVAGFGNDSDAKPALQAGEQRPEPLLEDWTKPLLAIVLTGEQQGYLEPCGCSEKQSGGLARRADFVKQLEARDWPVTGFDLGGTLKRTRRQSEMKFEYTRSALNEMDYKGLGLGPEELKLGVLKLFESYSGTQADDSFDVPFISANATFFGTRDLGTPLQYRVFETAGVKVGVTAVLGETFQKEMFAEGLEPDESELKIDPVDEVLPGVIQQMQAEMAGDPQQPQVMILLSHSRQPESRQLAQKYPQFNLVVTAGSPEDPDGRAETIGNTLLLKVGAKGKYAGIVGLYPGPKFRFETVELDRFRFGNAPEIDRLMEKYQQLLTDENLIATEPAVRHAFGEGYRFLGSEKCAECHDVEYDIWKESHHNLYAYKSLTVAYAQTSDDPSLSQRVRVDRIHDPECINCHTTGWDAQDVVRFESGFTGVETTPHLMGVHCESCHGPGSRHVELEENGGAEDLLLAERRKMHLSTDTAEVRLCIKCHDFENSPDFDFDTYWSEIAH